MRTVPSLVLPLVTCSTLLAVVACGPSKNSTTVKFEGESGFSKAIESCQGSLKSSQKQVVEKTVKVCRISDSARTDRTKEAKPELVDQPYFYEVSKAEEKGRSRSRVQVRLKVGLDLPSGLSDDEQDRMLKLLTDGNDGVCGRDLEQFYKRSVGHLPVQIRPVYFIVTHKPTQVVENYNELALRQTGGESGYPIYEMSMFEGGAKLYPAGDLKEKKRCDSITGTTGEKQRCFYDSFLKSNAKFCRQLAKVTGTWLGLSDEANERKACGLKDAETLRPSSSSFMKQASTQEPAEFFKTAALSKEDLATVLSDSCSGLASMIAPSPTPSPTASPSPTPDVKAP